MSKRLFVGITGNPGTGKTTAASHLASQGFYLFEGSTEIARAAKAVGVELKSRHDYNEFHRRMQHAHGKDWLAQLMVARSENRIVFSGLRSTHNAQRIQAEGGKVVALECPQEICLQRMDPTNPKNPRSVEEYLQQVAMDDSRDDYGASTSGVISLADYHVDTSRSVEHTQQQLDQLLADYESQEV